MTKAGEKCKGYAVNGETTCLAHTPRLMARSQPAAVAASTRKRQEAVERRKEASEQAKLSLTEVIRRDTAIRRAEISASLVSAAIADGNGAAMRELLNRVDGKVADQLVTSAGDTHLMTEAELEAQVLSWAATESPTVAEGLDSQAKDA
jgi:hypothetical protein